MGEKETATPEVDHDGAESCWSPNVNERRDGLKPTIIVLHYTGMADGEGAQKWLCMPESELSSHYIVHEDGRIVQMVSEAKRAWHAGQGSWHGQTDINSRSIGVEIVNEGHTRGSPEFPVKQIDAVIALCAGIMERHAISPANVIGHSDMAPGRKFDPGEKFPWAVLAAAGVAVHVSPSLLSGGRFFSLGDVGQPVEALQSMLALYGFNQPVTGEYDEMTRTHIHAFQMRQRPERVDGIADASTITTLRDFLKRVTLT
ncbi:MAG: N-acetylmuramoyl-L-alanine amidase [Pseudomonadota bacterium]